MTQPEATLTGPAPVVINATLANYARATDDELYAAIGHLSIDETDFAGPISRAMLAALGRELVADDGRVRTAVCGHHDTIKESIDPTSVTAVLALLLPAFGFPVTAVPAALVALAVLLLKIGLKQYCKGIG